MKSIDQPGGNGISSLLSLLSFPQLLFVVFAEDDMDAAGDDVGPTGTVAVAKF